MHCRQWESAAIWETSYWNNYYQQPLPEPPLFLVLSSDFWLRLQHCTANITAWILAVKREVQHNLSFSIPLGMLNPDSSDHDNKNLTEVRRKEQRD